MRALRPGTFLFWEAGRLPFNALLVMFAAAAFEELFRFFPTDVAWSYVWEPNVILAFAVANGLYSLIHPLDRSLQASKLQRIEDAGRIALWGGLTLLSSALVSGVVFSVVGAAFF